MVETDGMSLNGLSVSVSLQGCIVLGEEWKKEGVNDPFSRLYFVKEGNGYLRPEQGEMVQMQGGYLYFVPAGLTFSYGCKHLEKIYFHVNVTAEDGSDIFTQAKRIGVMPFSAEQYEALREKLFSTDYAGLLYVKGVLGSVLGEFGEQFSLKTQVPRYSRLVRTAMQVILQNTRIDWHAKKLAAELFVSESNLRKSFKRETGTGLHEYVERQVFTKAKSLLAGNTFTIDEISETLGFCDRFYFSRRFAAVFGVTPVLYRKNSSYGRGKESDEK